MYNTSVNMLLSIIWPRRQRRSPGTLPPIDFQPRRRFLRVSAFFLGVVIHIYLFDILLGKSPLTRWWSHRTALRRYRTIARQFRTMAIALGGMQIKLGQFLSTRADILPPEVTAELSGLQDEVPPVPAPYILDVIMQDLGATPEELFASFDIQPVAAASLGQVHYAVLHDGRPAAVKVQRPQIDAIIAVDLSAVRWVIRLVKNYPPIRRRANLEALFEEFARVLIQELDYVKEGANSVRFQRNFASIPGIAVPVAYQELTTRRVLVMERINGIKITNYAALDAAGVDRHELADRLNRAYLKQFFLDGFFHADPHPGNLFVRIDAAPADLVALTASLPPVVYHNGNGTLSNGNGTLSPNGDGADPTEEVASAYVSRGVPCTLIMIDFGMVGELRKPLMDAMRDAVVGLATNEPERMVAAMERMGLILPGSDHRPIVAALRTLMRYSYNRTMREITNMDVEALFAEIKDVIYDLPFQVPQELIYLGRAMSMVSGIATGLNPDINLFASVQPFARQLLEKEQREGDWVGRVRREITELTQILATLPRQMDAYYRAANNGELTTRADMTRLERGMRRVETATNRLAGGIVAASLFLGGAQLRSAGRDKDADMAWRAAAVAALYAVWPRNES